MQGSLLNLLSNMQFQTYDLEYPNQPYSYWAEIKTGQTAEIQWEKL